MTMGIFQDASGSVLPTLCAVRGWDSWGSMALERQNPGVPLGSPCRPAGWTGQGLVYLQETCPVCLDPLGGCGGRRCPPGKPHKGKAPGFSLRVSSLSLQTPAGLPSTEGDFSSCGILQVTLGDARR